MFVYITIKWPTIPICRMSLGAMKYSHNAHKPSSTLTCRALLLFYVLTSRVARCCTGEKTTSARAYDSLHYPVTYDSLHCPVKFWQANANGNFMP